MWSSVSAVHIGAAAHVLSNKIAVSRLRARIPLLPKLLLLLSIIGRARVAATMEGPVGTEGIVQH